MPIQFPSNPTLNQSYTYNSRTWTWSGTKWVLELAQQLQVDWAETDNTQLDFIKNKPNIPSTITWQTPQTANFTAVANRAYPVNTTSAAITVTLPQNPVRGDLVTLIDYAGKFHINFLTIDPGSLNINGQNFPRILSSYFSSAALVYVDSTKGWQSYSYSPTSLPGGVLLEYLVVAGGGGGNGDCGGGGAGGFRTGTLVLSSGINYSIVVGAGGTAGGIGSDSTISTVTSTGGGRGGSSGAAPTSGGSGGGAGGYFGTAPYTTGGQGNVPATSPSQGNNGGNYIYLGGGATRGGGGGGGAGGQGGTTSGSSSYIYAGNGGLAASSLITGTLTYYSGGGGGGAQSDNYTSIGGLGGGTSTTAQKGGGGNGGQTNQFNGPGGSSGTANTGGGGGGSGRLDGGGAGGSGIVILAYPDTSPAINSISVGLTYTLSTSIRPGYRVYTFTAGTGLISW